MLYDSLKRNKRRGAIFSKIDGKATSLYYYIDGISAAISGFLFAINGYLPMIFCVITNIISIVLSVNFEEIDIIENKEDIKTTKKLSNLRKSFKNIFRSSRLRNILFFGAIFSGILSVLVTLRSSLLSDIEVPPQYFGIIFALLGLVSGVSAKNQNRIHNKFRNKTLASLSLPVVISMIFLGLWCNVKLGYILTLIFVLIMFLIQYIAKGPFYTLIRRYMNNLTT